MMPLDLVLPSLAGVELDDLTADRECVHLYMSAIQPQATCPLCQQVSTRVHSQYQRQIGDLPWAGIPVRIVPSVRRFFCDHPPCNQRIFCERLVPTLPTHARRTDRLTRQLCLLSFALGGETGARLAPHLGLPTSADTLLRLIEKTPLPEFPTPQVLGVDDWAQRKGQVYGAVLVDLEQHRPIDLLPDRSAENLAEWLKAHPGVKIISRDRATAYAEGATQGAPEAVQVADRFHLLQNLRDALQRFLARHPQELRETATRIAVSACPPDPTSPEKHPPMPITPCSSGEEEHQEIPQSIPLQQPTSDTPVSKGQPSWAQLRFAEVKALQQQGWSQRAIARQLHLGRPTVHRYWAMQTLPNRGWISAFATSKTTPFWPYLLQRWNEGCHSGRQLFAELQQQGFTGSYCSLWRAMRRLPDRAPVSKVKPPASSPVSPRQGAWLLLRPPEALKPEQKITQAALCEISNTIAQAHSLAQTFARMLRQRKEELLDPWLADAEASVVAEIRHFALHLKRDYQAVKAALRLPWSNGPVEGHIHRLKLIKRQMYGRAHFALLRKRVLYAL